LKLEAKKSFIKVVVAAFSIKILVLNLKSYFSLPAEIFLSVWNVVTWKAFCSINLEWKVADRLGHAKSLMG